MPGHPNTTPVVLTIAGFDPSGGAGLIADIRTLSAFGCRPAAALTSLTFQNSSKVSGSIHQTAEILRAQILPILEEFDVAAVKIGVLPTIELVLETVRLLQEAKLPAPVVDPVLRSSSGYELMEAEAREAWLAELMPLARLITPNIPEAESLTGTKILNEADLRVAAVTLRARGAQAVVIKGGHLKQTSEVRSPKSGIMELLHEAIDLIDDRGEVTVFRGEWIEAPARRGTGCMLSSAIAACLSRGMKLTDAVQAARQFVRAAIRNSVAD